MTKRETILAQSRHFPASPASLARIFSTVHQEDDCWIWEGAVDEDGYPQVFIAGGRRKAHRIVAAAFCPDLNGNDVHHKCGERRCLNPLHLTPVDSIKHRDQHLGLTDEMPF